MSIHINKVKFWWAAYPVFRYIFFRTKIATLQEARTSTDPKIVLVLISYILALKKDAASPRARVNSQWLFEPASVKVAITKLYQNR